MNTLMYYKKLPAEISFNQNLDEMIKVVGGDTWYEDEWELKEMNYKYKGFDNKKRALYVSRNKNTVT